MNKTIKRVYGLLMAVLVVGVFLAWKIESSRRNDPMYSLNMLLQIKTEDEFEQKKEYFTPKGYGLTKWMASKCENQTFSGPPANYSAPQFNPDGGCDIWIIDGGEKSFLHFVKGKYWQFDDICLYSTDDLVVNVWMSDIKDHPVSSVVGGGLKYANEYVKKHMIELYSSLLFGLL